MSSGRKRFGLITLGCGAAAVVGWLTLGWGSVAAEPDADDGEGQNTWQWKVKNAPAPADGGAMLRLVLRRAALPPGAEAPTGGRLTALRAGDGDDHLLGDEPLGGETAGRVGLQLIDTRSLGLSGPPPAAPLRMATRLKVGPARDSRVARLSGHSVRQVTRHPAARWSNRELPLLTVATIDRDREYVYTFLLQIGREGD